MSLEIKDLRTTLDAKGLDPERFDFDIVTIPEKGQFIRFKLKQFLKDRNEFGKIATIVRDIGGEYIKGPGAHFRIPREGSVPHIPQIEEPTIDKESSLQEMVDEFEMFLTKLRKEGEEFLRKLRKVAH